jgi:hypothetical protein
MVQLHAWATIRESYVADNEDDNIETIIKQIKKFVHQNDLDDWVVLKFFNGTPYLSITMDRNRFTDSVKSVLNLYEYIGQIANGSYGLIYLHDDEDKHGMDNAFQVFVLARGILNKKRDDFLSPLIPMVEDSMDINHS